MAKGKAAQPHTGVPQAQPPQQPREQPQPPLPLPLPLPQLKLTPKHLDAQVVNEHMLLVPGVLTVAEAQRLIDVCEARGLTHQSSRGPAFGEAFRDNHRISMQDRAFAEQLWRGVGLQQVMRGVQVDGLVPVGLNPNIRFYRYTPGQQFGKHIDDSVEVAPGQVTGYTLLVYLSGVPQHGGAIDITQPPAAAVRAGSSSGGQAAGGKGKRQKHGGDCSSSSQAVPGQLQQQQQQQQLNTSALQELVGGETVFYGHKGRQVACVRPAAGLALLHLHGEDRCLEHEGAPVLKGVKYVLRSDVVFAAA